MVLTRKSWLPVVALAVVGGMTVGCSSKKSSGGTTTPAITATSVPAAISRDVVLSGALNIVANSLGFMGLTPGSSDATAVGNYRVNCVTFEDTPKAGYADVDATTGEFTATLVGFAGAPFGCFLLQKQTSGSYKNLSSIVFDSTPTESGDEDSQLVAGNGSLKIALAYDADLGSVSAVVDTVASTSLAADKIAEATTAAAATTTTLADMTGTYALACEGMRDPTDESKFIACPTNLGGDMPTSIYFHEFADGATRKVGLWPSKEALTGCFGATPGSELNPTFGAKLSTAGTMVSFDMSNLTKLGESFDQLITQLPDTAINTIVSATETTWQVENCQRMEQQVSQMQNAYSDATCRFYVPGVESKDQINPDGTKGSWEMMKWYDSVTDLDADITAGNAIAIADGDTKLSKRSQSCWNAEVSAPVENMPPCPWDKVHPNGGAASTEKTMTFDSYDYQIGTNFRQANFACKNPFGSGDSLQTFPVQALTKAENVAAVKANFAGAGGVASMNKECLAITNPWTGTGTIYAAQANEVRRTFFDLMRNAAKGSEGGGGGTDTYACTRFTPPASMLTFNFKGWVSGEMGGGGGENAVDGEKWNQVGGNLWWNRNVWNSLRIKPIFNETTGIITSIAADATMQQQPWFDYSFTQGGVNAICGTVITNGMDNTKTPDEWNKTFATECQTEFLGKDLATQLTLIAARSFDAKNIPPSTAIQCSADTSLKGFFDGFGANSCVPDFDIMTRCDGGQCIETLRCWGTEDGACTDASGKYKGRVPGRFELMTLKPRINNAFDLAANTTENWEQWEDNKPKVCKRVNTTLIQGDKVSEGVFTGIMSNKGTQYCEGDEPTDNSKNDPDMKLRFTLAP